MEDDPFCLKHQKRIGEHSQQESIEDIANWGSEGYGFRKDSKPRKSA